MKGDSTRRVAELQRAQELDPLSLVINSVLGATLATADRGDEAIEQLRKTIEMDPTFDLAPWFLGQAYEDKGRLAEAIAQNMRKPCNLVPTQLFRPRSPGPSAWRGGKKRRARYSTI